jgi:hypothetical protein
MIFLPALQKMTSLMDGIHADVCHGDLSVLDSLRLKELIFEATTYRALIRSLTLVGFIHHQYSVRRKDNATALGTYYAMTNLRFALPYSKLATTVKGMKMHYMSHLFVMDQTVELSLGGFFEPGLHINGPTPRNLVMNAGIQLVPPPVQMPAGGFILPQNTRLSQNALNHMNWLTG